MKPIELSDYHKYSLDNLPRIDIPSFMIESYFLRHIKTESIPNLELYLAKLNKYDWTCLLAENPRDEFLKYLSTDMKAKLDWDYINICNKAMPNEA